MEFRKLAGRAAAVLALSVSASLAAPVMVVSHPAPRLEAGQASQHLPDPAIPERTPPVLNPVPDGGRAALPAARDELTTVWDKPDGTYVLNPASGRHEAVDHGIAQTAVLMGDSQAGGAAGIDTADTWLSRGLEARGYTVRFVGAGGTGFVAGSAAHPNFVDAVESGAVILPYGNPALVVLEGGGNDAAQGAADAAILANAERLLRDMKASYPTSQFLVVGTLGAGAGSPQRAHVDAVLAGFARSNGLPFISAGDWIMRHRLGGKMADGVHLTAAGHQVLTGVFAGKLADLGLAAPGH
ncbi:acyl-CoA thioesterase-1 [Arthrobacter stackebrandtii]|uniref:Acyl-CoA thioesterase-1 n=1 Tax=Arthrobacter stackebrandtii TaxID=272161 RepID=A0ABS4YY08_9MICC|nr:SGNH/GDSL hydrolase family protein [Arthrobacter stackebrandtii]MBP2413701.1 acyl-CoA thioesterase-1 [Arthrobacter stackebrandtii]PYG99999.1 GDSL family lipase [Arthrobacter stackebrandtii]